LSSNQPLIFYTLIAQNGEMAGALFYKYKNIRRYNELEVLYDVIQNFSIHLDVWKHQKHNNNVLSFVHLIYI